jgi:ferrochelatase
LDKLRGCTEITVVPLYPQYAASSTGTALAEVYGALQRSWDIPALRTVPHFYNLPGYIDGVTRALAHDLCGFEADHILFSYHGLPERHLTRSGCADATTLCPGKVCPTGENTKALCYRSQCYETTRLVMGELAEGGKTVPAHSVSFQSRLGRTPWIKPYSDLWIHELYKQGVRKLMVVSPSFVVDCLETLEEINIRTRAQWLALGGTSFHYVPCLNAEPQWATALSTFIKQGSP